MPIGVLLWLFARSNPCTALSPKNIIPNNKLANQITQDLINVGVAELTVSNRNARKKIITTVVLSCEDESVNCEGSLKFTPYDREVHNAVISLNEAGNEAFTPDMVFRAMNGMTASEKVSQQAIGAVTRSLDKARKILIKIDFSREAQAYKKDCEAAYDGYLLACEKVTVSAGGHTKEAYRLLRKPILYEYAQVSGQILTVPISVLQTKGILNSTEDAIVIRGYLLRQIAGMQSRKFNRNKKILWVC